jgi:hypothetical protein
MTTQYPSGLDVFTRLVDEFDKLTASYCNQLFDALQAIQATLGTDPANLGASFVSFSDIQAILIRLARVEVGRFGLSLPAEAPLKVDFVSGTDRFTDSTKMAVFCVRVNTKAGRVIPKKVRYSAVITNSGGLPDGFDFYRWDMDTIEDLEEEWVYLAMEETL